MGNILTSLLSSWAEIHAAVMGIGLGLVAAVGKRTVPAGRWGTATVFTGGMLVGINLNVSPWEGWWHIWYILVPFAAISYLLSQT